jgi:hypothetical protein
MGDGLMQIKKAKRGSTKLRMQISGPSGSGKTYTSLRLATLLGKKVGCIDTEDGSAEKYAPPFDFDHLDMGRKPTVDDFVDAMGLFHKAGCDFLIIDSGTHAWEACKRQVDEYMRNKNIRMGIQAWAKFGTPLWNKFIKSVTRFPGHLICTSRAKTIYEISDDGAGKKKVEKLGTGPQLREGTEFEFDIVSDMDLSQVLAITKTRCIPLNGKNFAMPGEEQDLVATLKEWLEGAK